MVGFAWAGGIIKTITSLKLLFFPHFTPRNILGNGLSTIKGSSFFFMNNNDNNNPVGVGFCVGGQKMAISSYHTIHNILEKRQGESIRGFFGSPHEGHYLDLIIINLSSSLNIATMKIIYSSFSHQSLIMDGTEKKRGDECILVSFQLSRSHVHSPLS